MSRIVFIAPMPIMREEEPWRTSFLDRSRNSLSHESIFRVEMTLLGTDNEVEVGLLSSGDSKFFSRIVEFADRVQDGTGVQVKVTDIIGAPPKDSDAYEPKHFTTEDFGDWNEEQFRKQQPLGHQIVSQLKTGSIKSAEAFGATLSNAINISFEAANFSKTTSQVFDEMGDGAVAVAVAPEGTALAVWDGNQRITLNMFTFDSDNAAAFFQKFTKELSMATVLSRDEQPRGVNRVINFAKDLY